MEPPRIPGRFSEVHVRAWQSAYRGVMPDDYLDGLQAQDHATRWREHRIAPSSEAQLLIVVDDRRVVGFASLGPERDCDAPSDIGQLYAINLDPDVWGRGIGRALLNVATDRLRELGYVEAVLWVVPDNRRARRLYESEGWSDDDLRRDDEVFGVVVSQMRYRRLLASRPTGQARHPNSASGYPASPFGACPIRPAATYPHGVPDRRLWISGTR